MKDIATKVLALYDELKRDSLDLHTFFEMAGEKSPNQHEDVLDTVAELVGVGMLREGDGGDFYQRTEAGRLAVAGPKEVTLYTREGCHLCDSAKSAIEPALREFGARLREVDIDRDPVLQRRYNDDVPVVFIGSQEAARNRVDASDFRRKLEQANRR
ncbi:MAG TPA: glutaredoxin family protein [Candidatus Acidoferrales bacterium]|nr:glutaredoxin family protein [Candidatus Acidoferrales bacterium]